MVPNRARTSGFCRCAATLIYCLLTGLAWLPTTGAASQPVAAPEGLAGSRHRTRFVIGLEREVEPRIFALTNPHRVIVDLPELAVHLPTMTGDAPVGLVRSFRGGLAAADKFRVIIDVTEPVIIERTAIEPAREGRSARLVIEIVPADADKAAARRALPSAMMAGIATVQPPLPRPAERPEARAARSYKRLIVLDPGHGGHDSGAVRNGAVEKDVVLAFSLVLRDRLKSSGRYKVVMTRDDDTFVPLDDRRELAENHNAALFMAIHADSAGSQARGATVYSLREGVANDLKRSARGDVIKSVLSDKDMVSLRQAPDTDVGTVKGFLAGLAEREVLVTRERTSAFARSLVEYMSASTTMMTNPDRSAAFTVLRTAKVPAVLVELAFVTNREDAAKLKSDQWRASVASSLVTAIDAYFADPASSPLR